MRNLSRIVFINSANIPYSDIRLDGNVHFIGTQGVGKSTILRAILFFYNAAPSHLGIPKEKKSFDSFYFPYSNSYIVYEIQRENGAYCVITFRSMGRICYRFVDSTFDKQWFIGEDNKALEDWAEIRNRINDVSRVSPSKAIKTYEFFRDVIYGNNRRPEMVEFRKYAIVESAKYQNIPRTVQNVFLNTKLDADFIKDTIIKSMTDDETRIDLDYFRNQIREFENEYNDIYLWIKKESNGTNKKTILAHDVVKKYNAIRYSKKRIHELREELNFALKKCDHDRPEIENKIRDIQEDLERTNRLLKEENGKFLKERDEINKEISVLEDKIKTSRSRKKAYSDMNISDIIRRVSKEDELNIEKKRTEEIRGNLVAGSTSIDSKYKQIEDSLRATAAEISNSLNAELAERAKIKASKENDLHEKLLSNQDEIRRSEEDIINSLENKIHSISDESNTEQIRRVQVLQKRYYDKEISEKEAAIVKLNNDITRYEADKQSLIKDQDSVRKEEDWQLKECGSKYNVIIESLSGQEVVIESTITKVRETLDSYKGSFCEWLTDNIPGWQENIGKVVDEDKVLYNKALSPNKCNPSNNLFGVELDLSSIEKDISTPESLKQRIEGADAKLTIIRREREETIIEREREIKQIREKFNKKGKEISDKIQELSLNIYESEEKIKQYRVEISDYSKRGSEERKSALDNIDNTLDSLSRKLESAKNELQHYKLSLDKNLKTARKEFDNALKALNCEFKNQCEKINDSLHAIKSNLDKDLGLNAKARLSELKESGTDIESLNHYENKIKEIDKELVYIKSNRSHVSDYEKDKRELFERESEFLNSKKSFELKLTNLEMKYEHRKNKLEKDAVLIEKELELKQNLLTENKTNKDQAVGFMENSSLSPYEEMTDNERQTESSCKEIINDLTSRIISQNNDMKLFKMSVNSFRDGFSSRNLFNFKTGMVTDTEFLDFAAGLDSFLSEDMLQDYQKRISERYTDIIRRIAKETSDLTKSSSDINKVINEINAGFSKDNFVGAIKSISLKQVPSENKIIQLLLTIKEFNEANQYNMGEVDLFTQDNRDDVNNKAVDYLIRFMKALQNEPETSSLGIADSFKLEFRIVENDNDTGWIEKISNVGSDGTDILVKAMINIMLINVFKERASRKFGDFRIHCMMDEIGKLHPSNIKGILNFANQRNILLINSSPTTFNADDYKYTYLLEKERDNKTKVIPLIRHLS